MSQPTIRYAIRLQKNPPTVKGFCHYVTRDVGLSHLGGLSMYLEEAKTFASPRSARAWMYARPEWLAYREAQGTLSVVQVRMGRRAGNRSKAVEVLAG